LRNSSVIVDIAIKNDADWSQFSNQSAFSQLREISDHSAVVGIIFAAFFVNYCAKKPYFE